MSMPVADSPHTFTARTYKPLIAADSSNALPSRIEIMRAGTWPSDSNKGAMNITDSDLLEFKTNFDSGTGMAGGSGTGLPIDFEHEYWGKAAGWMKGLVVEAGVLYADPVEWTSSGSSALEGGEYKCISPMFTPACLGEWHDPEDWNVTARNVLEGAALTNIPFFKDLTPITASRKDGEIKNVIYVNASQIKEQKHMTLADVRVKANDQLSDEERAFLVEHKAELTADELTSFGLEAPKQVVADKKAETPVVKADAVKGDEGKVLIEASEIKGMFDRVKSLESSVAASHEKDVKAEVLTHVKRGAIKADQVDTWVSKIVADSTMVELLDGLSDNAVMAAETGKAAGTGDATKTAATELHERITADMKASEGKLSYADAQKNILMSDKELSERINQERKEQ